MNTEATAPAFTPGEHEVDGVTIVINGIGGTRWRSDCGRCVTQGKGAFAPQHDASSSCESGSRKHCTCDRCF
jgi:hypothetical protein